MTQMDLFDDQQIANLRQEIDKVGRSADKVRKGLYGRHMQLEKYMVELQEQIEQLEKEVYRLKLALFTKDCYPQEYVEKV